MSEAIYEVAVSTDPLLWVIHCELCNDEFGVPTDDDSLLALTEDEHKQVHNL